MTSKLHIPGGVMSIWMVANFLGVAVIGVFSLIPPILVPIRGIVVSSLLLGLPIGIAQWIALRRVAPISILWALTISAGLIVGLVVSPSIAGFLGFHSDESVGALTAICTIIGLMVGLAQWVLLRGHFTRSLIWLLGSAAGLGLGTYLVLVSNLINQSGILSIILAVLVYGFTTGFVISWLPTYPRNAGSIVLNST